MILQPSTTCHVMLLLAATGALPIPGFPHGPSTPFTYSVLGSAVVHLLAQTLVFGAAAVLLDVGVMQILRRAWAGMQHAGRHKPHTHHSSSKGTHVHAGADVEAGVAPVHGIPGDAAGVDADVAAERVAVEAADSLEQAMVSCGGWVFRG